MRNLLSGPKFLKLDPNFEDGGPNVAAHAKNGSIWKFLNSFILFKKETSSLSQSIFRIMN